MIPSMKTGGFILVAVMMVAMQARAEDHPSVPQPQVLTKNWQLKFDFEDPQRIEVQHPGQSAPTIYWYLIYSVTNQTDEEIEFYPSFELVTSTLHVTVGGENISSSVYHAIAQRHSSDYPFLVEPTKASGRLLRGADNTRTSVAVFRQFDLTSNAFSIFVGGLAGEIERVGNVAFDASKPPSDTNPPFFYLRKTLKIDYALPGDLGTREVTRPSRINRSWVMR